MEKALEFFGFFVLAILGFVAPLFSLLLPYYQEGIIKLKEQYEKERDQAAGNINQQVTKINTDKEDKFEELQNNLNELKRIQKESSVKANNLQPHTQLRKIFSPLIISFMAIIVAFLILESDSFIAKNVIAVVAFYMVILISLCIFFFALYNFWILFSLIIEVKELIDNDKKIKDGEIKQILINILNSVSKEKEELLKNLFVSIEGKKIAVGSEQIAISSDNKKQLKISATNNEQKMAKNVEVGLIFPSDFIIDKSSGYTITNNQNNQIVRYKVELFHAMTAQNLALLNVTALKEGLHEIKMFIKGENVQLIRQTAKILVVK